MSSPPLQTRKADDTMDTLLEKLDTILGILKDKSDDETKVKTSQPLVLAPVHKVSKRRAPATRQTKRPRTGSDPRDYGSASAPRPTIEPPNARIPAGRVPADVLIQHLTISYNKKTRENFSDRPEMIPGSSTLTWDEVCTIDTQRDIRV